MKQKLFTTGFLAGILMIIFIGGAEVFDTKLNSYSTFSITVLSLIIGVLTSKLTN